MRVGIFDYKLRVTLVGEVKNHLVEYPRGEYGLGEVVEYQYLPQVEGLPVFHDPGSQYLAEVRVRQAYGHRGPRTAHHRPILHSGICKVNGQFKIDCN